jgi:coproporphyrinogen III oxidase-like Fe-S oxidoreductase
MHIMTCEAMKELKYDQPIVDWFVRSAHHFHQYQDHNWRQTDRIPLLGLGASAYSYLGGMKYYNVNNLMQYIEWINKGRGAVWRGEGLPFDERMRRTVVLGLKMGINTQNFALMYGVDFHKQFSSTTRWLEEIGLLQVTPKSIRLTYLGALFADEVCRQYYSPAIKQRMSAIDPLLISTTHPRFNP